MTDTVKIAIEADSKGVVPAVKKVTESIDGLGDQAKVTGREIGEMGRDVRETETKVDKMAAATERAAKGVRRMGSSAATIRSVGKASVYASEKIANQYTSLAGGIGVAMAIRTTAKLDQSLTRIKQTANASVDDVAHLRSELFRMSAITGRPVEELAAGFDDLVQSGQTWPAALAEIEAINVAMGVTGASASELAGGLRTAAEAYQIDLSQPGKALALLDKFRVAGKAGNAELANISDIFARIGPSAKSAGMDIDQALAFVEVLSATEENPERLATMSDSVLRLFNNLNYQKAASKATGVSFYNKDRSKRDAGEVLLDIRKRYAKLKDDLARDAFIQKAFGKSDLDTIKGLRVLLSGTALDRMSQFGKDINASSGTLNKELGEALDNGVSQAERLVAILRKGADDFSRPVVNVLKVAAKVASDHPFLAKSAAVTTVGIVGTATAVVVGAKVLESIRTIRGFMGKKGSTTGGILGQVMSGNGSPVFVTNWPMSMGGGNSWQKYGSPTIGGPGSSTSSSLPESVVGGRGYRYASAIARRPGAWGAAIGVNSLLENGNTVEGWGGFSGAIFGAEAGAKLGSFAGPFGAAAGTLIGATLGQTVAPWLAANVAEHDQKVQNEKAAEFFSSLESGKMRIQSAASDAARAPINLNLVNQIDSQGRISTSVTGPDADSVTLKSKVIQPDWARGDL